MSGSLYDNAFRWAMGHGLILSGLRLSDTADAGRGLVAMRDINAGELLLSIPHTLLIQGSQSVADLGGTNALALGLLEERAKGAASHWQPYIDVLPKGDFGTPLFFNITERHWLRGTDVLRWALARESSVLRTHGAGGGNLTHVIDAGGSKIADE